MKEICCVPNCANTSLTNSRLSFHRFPSNTLSERRKKWLKAVHIPHDNISVYTKVCSDHFKSSDFRRTQTRKLLSYEAVPTKRLPSQMYRWRTNDIDDGGGEELIDDHRFRNSCRFCLEPTTAAAANSQESIRMDWTAWPHSEYTIIYEEITRLKFPVSANCSELCCGKCVNRLHESQTSLSLFRKAFDFWQRILSKNPDNDHHIDAIVKTEFVEAAAEPVNIPTEYVDVNIYQESIFGEAAALDNKIDITIEDNDFTKDPEHDAAKYQQDIQTDPPDGLWPCKYCDGHVAVSKQKLDYHQKNVHFSHWKKFQCEHCSKRYYSRSSLDTHKLSHKQRSSPKAISECKICSTVFRDNRAMLQHVRLVHAAAKQSVDCSRCGQTFPSAVKLKWHSDHADECNTVTVGNRVAPAIKFQCHLCNKTFDSLQSVQMHIRYTKHRSAHFATTDESHQYQCDICKNMFKNKRAVRVHLKCVHMKSHKFMCDGCAAPFYNAAGLRRHLPRCNRQHGYVRKMQFSSRKGQPVTDQWGDTFPCRLCVPETFFDNKMLLGQHYKRDHCGGGGGNDGMDTVCIWCNTKFEFAHQLQQHQIEPLVHCVDCRTRPKCPTAVETHRRRHLLAGHKNQCDVCQKTFVTMKNMKLHKRTIHMGERRYKCDECDKAFFDRSHLGTHKNSHYRQRNQVVDD